MASRPVNRIQLRCHSLAEHLGFAALNDVAKVMADKDGRVIGGHMIALHVQRWGLDLFRTTQDADLGVTPAVVQTPLLTDRLIEMGYVQTAGNRFERPVIAPGSSDVHRAAIDILVPAYTSRPRSNRGFGDHLVTTEVPGLAAAYLQPPVDLVVDVEFLDGAKSTIAVLLPDEVAALGLKVMARTVRSEDRDAVDVWRSLEVCFAAGLQDIQFGPDDQAVRKVLDEQFSPGGLGIQQIGGAQNLSAAAQAEVETRIQALRSRLIGSGRRS